jgi:glycine cleavage system H lipoate-binding protein
MFPWVYEFQWTPGHVIFLGVFFSVIVVIAATVARSSWKAFRDIKNKRIESIRWKVDFEDLPQSARVCRHEMTGEVKHRFCDNEFDCRGCRVHAALLAQCSPSSRAATREQMILGFRMPSDRLYHRGHTWVRPEGENVYSIGLDDFVIRMVGSPEGIELPPVGEQLRVYGTGWHIRKRGSVLRVLSPLDGTVIALGGPEKEWYLKVRSEPAGAGLGHLLGGAEIQPWIMRELERLQRSLTPDGVGFSLADGGEVLPDIWKDYPDIDWDAVWGEMLLAA